MLVINSIEKTRLSADSYSYSGTGVAWKARLVLFLGFALMAGGLAGSVVSRGSHSCIVEWSKGERERMKTMHTYIKAQANLVDGVGCWGGEVFDTTDMSWLSWSGILMGL